MKKLYFVLIGILLMLTGCSSDEEYINTVKKITFPDGVTVEKMVDNNVKAGETYLVNDKNLLFNEAVVFMLSFGSKDEINFTLRQSGFTLPEKISEIKWGVEGKTKTGKVIVASNDKIKVKIETEENGDYIETKTSDIITYELPSNKVIPQEELDIMGEFYNLAIKNGYTNQKVEEVKESEESEYKPFDEKAFLKNESGENVVKYYPSGRVKFISDGYMEVELEDRSNLKDIAKGLVWLQDNIGKQYVNALVDYSIELEYQIIAEKLNKKITNSDKEKIKKLETQAVKVFDKLQEEVNNTTD
ncbi:lipoprotein [Fusobacterium sp.]|uniref:lipoprotein n=1 Tax=Fusobacterium sp. TaxID=68766 RepID=UPI00262121C3|nr:lipoprotein [Fusobacterium sp.]MDY3059075.1 lipoprotein [Fusobacterium sp.]